MSFNAYLYCRSKVCFDRLHVMAKRDNQSVRCPERKQYWYEMHCLVDDHEGSRYKHLGSSMEYDLLVLRARTVCIMKRITCFDTIRHQVLFDAIYSCFIVIWSFQQSYTIQGRWGGGMKERGVNQAGDGEHKNSGPWRIQLRIQCSFTTRTYILQLTGIKKGENKEKERIQYAHWIRTRWKAQHPPNAGNRWPSLPVPIQLLPLLHRPCRQLKRSLADESSSRLLRTKRSRVAFTHWIV